MTIFSASDQLPGPACAAGWMFARESRAHMRIQGLRASTSTNTSRSKSRSKSKSKSKSKTTTQFSFRLS